MDVIRDSASSRPYVIAAVALALCCAAYLIYPVISKAGQLPVVQESPDFTLFDLDGNPAGQSDWAGKVRLMEFFFTSCPDICPITTANMVAMQEPLKEKGWFGKKVQFVGITFDPVIDTPEQLRKYAERIGIDYSGWSLLRDEEEAIKELAARYGIMIQRLGDGQFVHTVTSLLLIDGQDRVRKVYPMGEAMDNEAVMRDIASLVKEG